MTGWFVGISNYGPSLAFGLLTVVLRRFYLALLQGDRVSDITFRTSSKYIENPLEKQILLPTAANDSTHFGDLLHRILWSI